MRGGGCVSGGHGNACADVSCSGELYLAQTKMSKRTSRLTSKHVPNPSSKTRYCCAKSGTILLVIFWILADLGRGWAGCLKSVKLPPEARPRTLCAACSRHLRRFGGCRAATAFGVYLAGSLIVGRVVWLGRCRLCLCHDQPSRATTS